MNVCKSYLWFVALYLEIGQTSVWTSFDISKEYFTEYLTVVPVTGFTVYDRMTAATRKQKSHTGGGIISVTVHVTNA